MARLVDRRCGYCRGTGEVRVGDFVETSATCPVCDGFGFVRVPSDYRRCPDCNGTGKKEMGTFFSQKARCGRCQGTGWAEPPLPYR